MNDALIQALYNITSIDELRTINSIVVDRIKQLGTKIAYQLKVGDLVKFQSKNRGVIYARVSRFLPKNVELRQVDPRDVTRASLVWRVPPALLKPWDGQDPFSSIKV